MAPTPTGRKDDLRHLGWKGKTNGKTSQKTKKQGTDEKNEKLMEMMERKQTKKENVGPTPVCVKLQKG